MERAKVDNQFDQDVAIVDVAAEAEYIADVASREGEAGAKERAMEFAARRAKGELLGHVLGFVRFLDLELLTAVDCLVPRHETEIVGRAAIRELTGMQREALRVIDMCCGAGNLACAIGRALPQARVWASDLTDGCVNLARRNVEHVGLTDRVQVFQGDLFESLRNQGLEGSIDLIVCNPPYISSGRLGAERAELLDNEPREAFDGGPYGLTIHQRVLQDALDFLRPGGWLMFEFGLGQDRQLKLLFGRTRGAYVDIGWEQDAQGGARAAIARKAD
ncbi:MAG: peptide chain release factor N(5)-glutamine methyltransferase [Polyangiaceae bacterium]|nr:peptide chain release factor N(5)-glutamine methyltransferase [Polyangiaceae bacterium]MCB9605808.1 peptide chain release factor N(5)-glutamine methyltransferase [Polyangiaceae bacterium]